MPPAKVTTPQPAARRSAKSRPGFSKARAEHRVAGEPVERHAVEDHDPVGPAAPGAVLGDQPRQVAAPGDDGEPVRRHAASVRRGGEGPRALGGDEVDHLLHQRVAGVLLADAAHPLLQVALALEHLGEGGAQAVDVVALRRRGASARRG